MLTANRVHRLLEAMTSPAHHVWGGPHAADVAPPWRAATSDQGLSLEFDLPGVKPEHVSVETEGRELTISIKSPASEPVTGSRQLVREIQPRDGTLKFTLPFAIQADLIDVSLTNGVLQVSVRKPASAQRQSIPVQGAAQG